MCLLLWAAVHIHGGVILNTRSPLEQEQVQLNPTLEYESWPAKKKPPIDYSLDDNAAIFFPADNTVRVFFFSLSF